MDRYITPYGKAIQLVCGKRVSGTRMQSSVRNQNVHLKGSWCAELCNEQAKSRMRMEDCRGSSEWITGASLKSASGTNHVAEVPGI